MYFTMQKHLFACYNNNEKKDNLFFGYITLYDTVCFKILIAISQVSIDRYIFHHLSLPLCIKWLKNAIF